MSIEQSDRSLLKIRRTKIIATVGPSTREQAVIERLIRAGANLFRINMSHGTHEEHSRAFYSIRAASESVGEPVAILADLGGPKIRVGTLRNGEITLSDGQPVVITVRDVIGDAGLIPSQYETLVQDVRSGDTILLDDGMIELRVESVGETDVACRVVHGGVLKERKGMNLPGVSISAPTLTPKDREDALHALELGVDFLSLSFVRTAADVVELKKLIADANRNAGVIAKIEKPEAVAVIDDILAVSDAIMIARGDLGVEVPQETVPIIQQEIVTRSRQQDVPVIIATQMLESMISHPRPTRAEVSDVSHAVFSGADAVMLSGETAVGQFPVEAVAIMNHVAREVENWQWINGAFSSLEEADLPPPIPLSIAVARVSANLSRELQVRTLVVPTRTGATARVVSGARPAAPIIGLTSDRAACRRLCLLWGVIPKIAPDEDVKDAGGTARRFAREMGLADKGQYILLIAGFKSDPAESEPTVTVLQM